MIWTLPADWHTVPPPVPPHDSAAEAAGATANAAAAIPAATAETIRVAFVGLLVWLSLCMIQRIRAGTLHRHTDNTEPAAAHR